MRKILRSRTDNDFYSYRVQFEGDNEQVIKDATDKRVELFSASKPIEFDKYENWLVVLTTTRTMIKFLYSVLSFSH